MNQRSLDLCAEVAHETNRRYLQGLHEESPPAWSELADDLRELMRARVAWIVHGEVSPAQLYNRWFDRPPQPWNTLPRSEQARFELMHVMVAQIGKTLRRCVWQEGEEDRRVRGMEFPWGHLGTVAVGGG